jgi:hypothetical protein
MVVPAPLARGEQVIQGESQPAQVTGQRSIMVQGEYVASPVEVPVDSGCAPRVIIKGLDSLMVANVPLEPVWRKEA